MSLYVTKKTHKYHFLIYNFIMDFGVKRVKNFDSKRQTYCLSFILLINNSSNHESLDNPALVFLFQGLSKHRQSQAHRKVVAAAKAEKNDAADHVKGKGQQQGKYFVIIGACFN